MATEACAGGAGSGTAEAGTRATGQGAVEVDHRRAPAHARRGFGGRKSR
jgi:hypothetical protein